jgi:enoyl-CoA hydratase
MTTVSVDREGAVAVVTLASENELNVAEANLMAALRQELGTLAAETPVRVVILTGSGERAFCAGADIEYMSGLDAADAAEWGRLGHEVTGLLETMPKVTIAAIGGLALGGGSELALACDLRYASAKAKLGQPEVNFGLMPGWGGSQRLARLTGVGFAKELVLTGRIVGAEEALARGYVNGIHDPVLDRAREVAAEIVARGPNAIAAAKLLCNAALQGDHIANLAREAEAFGELFAGEEAHEGTAAFLEKRKPGFAVPNG